MWFKETPKVIKLAGNCGNVTVSTTLRTLYFIELGSFFEKYSGAFETMKAFRTGAS